MHGDILPPRQSKPRKTKSQLEKSSAFLHHRVAPAARQILGQETVRAEDIKPLVMDLPRKKAKRVSLARIKTNLRPKHWYNLTRQEQWVLLGGLSTILICIILCFFVFFRAGEGYVPPVRIPKNKYVPKPVTAEAPLTGLQVDPQLVKRPVTAIMIENSTDARPQSGLQDAGVVYEAIAEGGITRFIALFQDTRPQYIGPVRSLRPYYIDFATPWDAAIAHVGGSPEALSQIRNGGKDLDQFFNSGAYWRESSRDAPHNVYTSFDRLDALNLSKGYIASTPHGWTHKADKKLAAPTAKSIDVNISSALYNSHYDYDAASNSYLRSEGGKPHIMVGSNTDKVGAQLKPKVVIALVMSYGIQSDGKHSEYGVNGSGNVYIFQDGGVTAGTWTKTDRASQFSFKDASGADIALDAGQTWIAAISDTSKIHYQ